MGFMDLMMDRWMRGQSPEQKRDMMDKMMPKMMESMGAEDMLETMHEMMPRMMENCLGSMSEEERRKMLTFCRTMLGEMEEKFLTLAKK